MFYVCKRLPHLPQNSLAFEFSVPQFLHLIMPIVLESLSVVVFELCSTGTVLGLGFVFGRLVKNTKSITITITTSTIIE